MPTRPVRALAALALAALVVPLAPALSPFAPAAARTDSDLFAFATVAWFGEPPNGGRRLIAECHGSAPLDVACERTFPAEYTYFWVSACSTGVATCGPLTATFRLTYRDAETADDVWTCGFVAGRHTGCALESGTGLYRGATTFTVEALPPAGLDGAAPFGDWHVWVTSRR